MVQTEVVQKCFTIKFSLNFHFSRYQTLVPSISLSDTPIQKSKLSAHVCEREKHQPLDWSKNTM